MPLPRRSHTGPLPVETVRDLLGLAASDKIVTGIGLWLEDVVGDTRYQQFIAKDPSLSAWDVKP